MTAARIARLARKLFKPFALFFADMSVCVANREIFEHNQFLHDLPSVISSMNVRVRELKARRDEIEGW